MGIAIYERDKDATTAEAKLLKTLELAPQAKWAYHHLGEISQQEGRADEATVTYEQALEIDPDFKAAQRLVDETVAQHERLDFIFNNAGIAIGSEVRDCSIEHWRAVLDVNLYGVINGVAAAYPVMVKQGFGHIVNTASLETFWATKAVLPELLQQERIVFDETPLKLEFREDGRLLPMEG